MNIPNDRHRAFLRKGYVVIEHVDIVTQRPIQWALTNDEARALTRQIVDAGLELSFQEKAEADEDLDLRACG